jgi:pimeloyl-ACP methyl ester carboxylesterase
MTEPMVLLPGILSDIRLFLPQLTALGRERPVMVAPTCQGERIDEIASNLLPGLPQKFALAGHGFGGMVAMEVLRRAPERVTRVALISTSPLPETPQDSAERELRIVSARAGRFDDILAKEVPMEAIGAAHRKDIWGKLQTMGKAGGAETYVRQCRAMQRRRDQQSTLRRIKQPTLLICGAEDTIFPVKRHEFMAQLIPYAQLAVLPGVGHLPSLEAPAAFGETLRSWMKQPLVLQ